MAGIAHQIPVTVTKCKIESDGELYRFCFKLLPFFHNYGGFFRYEQIILFGGIFLTALKLKQ